MPRVARPWRRISCTRHPLAGNAALRHSCKHRPPPLMQQNSFRTIPRIDDSAKERTSCNDAGSWEHSDSHSQR